MGKKTWIIFVHFVVALAVSVSILFAFSDSSSMNANYKELFKLYNDVELMKSRKVKLEAELELLEKKKLSSGTQLRLYEAEVARKMQDYVELLRLRQKNGETSEIKMLLRSKNLSDFFYRMNITGILHNRYQFLVASLDKDILSEKELKEKLEADEREITKKKQELEISIIEKEKNIEKLEEYLQSRGSKREEYEKQLNILGEKWSELKPLFSRTVRSFVNLIESGGLPNDVIEVKIGFGGVRGIVREEVFNRLLAEAFRNQEDAAEIIFRAEDGGIFVHVPSHDVELFGSFDVTKHSLIYRVQRGSFSGIEIGESGIEDLFLGGTFEIDVTHILDIMGMELLDCKVKKGYIDIGIKLKY